MKKIDKDKLEAHFLKLEEMEPEEIMAQVEGYVDDEIIEIFVDHIENFYGVEDDEELGTLAQLMVSGYIAAMETLPTTKNEKLN